MAELCLASPSSGKSNYMFYFSQNKFTSRGEHSHISSSEKWLAACSARRAETDWYAFSEIIPDHHQ